MITVLAQLATHASRAIARAARMGTLGNLRGVLATPCRLLSLRLFYEAKMVTVLAREQSLSYTFWISHSYTSKSSNS